MQKLYYFQLIFLITIFGGLCPINAIYENKILELVEDFRSRMCHPIAKWKLPALDPFYVTNFEYSANNKYLIDFSASVNKFNLSGLSDFVVNKLRIQTLPLQRFTLDISFPLTAFETLYTAKGWVAHVVNLAADGNNARFSVENLRILAKANLRVGTKYLSIKNLKITIEIAGIEANFEHLVEEERINDFINALINELGLELANDIWLVEKEYVEGFIEKYINEFLGKYTLKQIIAIVGSDKPIFGPEDPAGDCKDTVSIKLL